MAKTERKEKTDKAREVESPAHKKRRNTKEKLRYYDTDEIEEDDYENFETFERIRKQKNG